jgi:glucosylceramidase
VPRRLQQPSQRRPAGHLGLHHRQRQQYYLYSADRELRIAGKCIGSNANGTTNGTKVITWDCNGTASQKWSFHANGNLTNDLSGLCLDVSVLGTANGSKVQLWSCTGNTNQTWTASNGA